MVKKKDLIIVALATFCLTATLFMVRPTKSNPGIGEYNSWTDLNGDGTVDIYDAITLADAYGTSGDSTRNVNVVSMPSRQGYEAYSFEGTISWTNYAITSDFSITPGHGIWFGGYSRLFIHLSAYFVSVPVGNVTVYISGLVWNITGGIAGHETFSPQECNVTFDDGYQVSPLGYGGGVMKVEIKGETIEYLSVTVESTVQSGSVSASVYLYLRNE
jgi:hypothetical protein